MQAIVLKTQTARNAGVRLWAIACAALTVMTFTAGCQIFGIAAVLGTPTGYEAGNTAEYNLAKQKNRKILVLVDLPAGLSPRINLRYYCTDSINTLLEQRAKIPAKALIGYDKLAEFRFKMLDFSELTPEQIGKALGADLVVYVVITDFQITETGESGFCSASLDAQAMLIDAATGEKLWPGLEQARLIRVGFESERRGQDAAAVRLAVGLAHCVTRYLYNCPPNQFKIADERATIGWE